MKLKKILASLTAAAMAVTTMAFAPVSAYETPESITMSSCSPNFILGCDDTSLEITSVPDAAGSTSLTVTLNMISDNYGWSNGQIGTNTSAEGGWVSDSYASTEAGGTYKAGDVITKELNTYVAEDGTTYLKLEEYGSGILSIEKITYSNGYEYVPFGDHIALLGGTTNSVEITKVAGAAGSTSLTVTLNMIWDNHGWSNGQIGTNTSAEGGWVSDSYASTQNGGTYQAGDVITKELNTYVAEDGTTYLKLEEYGSGILSIKSIEYSNGYVLNAEALKVTAPATTEISPKVTTDATYKAASNESEADIKAAVLNTAKITNLGDVVLDSADYTLTASDITDGKVTVTFALTEAGEAKYTLAEDSVTSASCEIITLYAVTVSSNNEAMGTASADVSKAAEGTKVTLTAKANDDYRFVKWNVVSPANLVITDNKFEMPAEAVEVTAVFEEDSYALTVTSDENGTASAKVSGAAAPEKVIAGKTVVLSAEPNTGYRFVKWTVTGVALDDVTSENVTFTMPASAVTAKATFEEIPAGEHAVTVKNVEGGTAVASAKSAIKNTEITLTVKPDAGHEFDKWTVSPETVVIIDNKFTMPDEAVTVTPVFKKIDYKITVSEAANGKLEVDKTVAQMGDKVTVTATPDKDYSLASITVNGKVISENTFTMPAENVTVSAEFTKTGFAVKASSSVGGKCTVDKANAQIGETVTVTVSADEGYELSEITVNGKAIEGNTFTMPAEDVTVFAAFKKLPGKADAEIEAPEGVDISFAGSKEDIIAAVFGDDYAKLVESGAKLDVVMTVKDESAVSENDKDILKNSLSKNQNIGLILDITLVKTVDGVSDTIAETSKPVSFKISVPDSIIADGRTYSVVRVHEGKAQNIGGTFDSSSKTITVSSDLFSTYAIVYDEAPAPKPVKPVTIYYSIVSDSHSTASIASAAAGTIVSVKTDFGYDAEVYCNGNRIAVISDRGEFTMPAGNVKIVSVDNGYLAMMRKALPNSYIFVYDSDMNYIKTNGSTRGIKGEGKITVKLGEEYAGKTITLYKGRKSTNVKVGEKTLNDDGYATFTVSAGMNYTAVVK